MVSMCLNDGSFGPIVKGCRGDFDFTQQFENIVLKLIPAAIFTSAALIRISKLARQPTVVDAVKLLVIKLVGHNCPSNPQVLTYSKAIAAVSVVLNFALLVLASTKKSNAKSNVLIPATAVTLFGSVCLVLLSYYEHSRSPRPSIILSTYLFITLLFEIAQARTLWLSTLDKEQLIFIGIFTSYVTIKAIMLVCEAKSKALHVRWNIKEHSPEETSGLYSLGAFYWLNRLFLKGYRTFFRIQDLFPLDQILMSEKLCRKFHEQLENNPLSNQKLGLTRLLLRCLAVNLLLPIPPRLALMGFQFCQPFLIKALLEHLQTSPDSVSQNSGYGLIGAAVFIYGGIAVSNALYWYYQERAMFMGRGMLVSALYQKATKTNSSVNRAPLTLMSTDVERIRLGLVNLHEFWASTVEAALACWLLEKELGAAFAAPFLLITLAAVASSVLGKFLARYQRAWMETIEKRVTLTSNVIADMKNIKISGLVQPIGTLIQNLRLVELKSGRRWRRLVTLSVIISFSPLLLSPVAAFVVNSRSLDTTSIFLSVSYLTLFTTPLCMLLQKLPQLLGAFTCLRRIQVFLEQEHRVDSRSFHHSAIPAEKKGNPAIAETNSDDIQMYQVSSRNTYSEESVITIANGHFGWATNKDDLIDINITIPASKLTMVTGPVASGKSTLVKALLGEVPRARGQVSLGRSHQVIGYCDQSPYLSNNSIRANIIGFAPFDQDRYDAVIKATMLLKDFAELPQGDLTSVGSSATSLSGGQRQRVAVARALYVESDLLIFDDALSGLDAGTDEYVFHSIFAADGILRHRGATAIMCTNSPRHLRYADHIIVLNKHGTVTEQRTISTAFTIGAQLKLKMENTPSIQATNQEALSPPQPVTQSIGREDENTVRQTGNKSVHRYYLNTIGLAPSAGFILASISWGFFYNFPQIWLKYWADDLERRDALHSSSYYVGIYSMLQILGLVSMATAVFIVLSILVDMSGSEMHRRALQTIINTPLQLFGETDIGVITSLFSQDMTLIDGELPVALNNFILAIFQVVGMATVLATSSPWLILTYPVLLVVMWGLQMFYLRTSRQLRLLSLEAREPL